MNANIWNLYKMSENGQQAIAQFTLDAESEQFEAQINALFEKYHRYFGGYGEVDDLLADIYLLVDNMEADHLFLEEGDEQDSTVYFETLIDSLELKWFEEKADGTFVRMNDDTAIVGKNDYRTKCFYIPAISLILFVIDPYAFFPILFRERFDILVKSCDALGIDLPTLPKSTDKKARLMFYKYLSDNILGFANEYKLTPQEMCACLYDFALLLINEDNDEQILPQPTNIWLTGGGKFDYEHSLKKPVKESEWTCNENTKKGDIIVMYCRTPYSCIQSVWRANIDGAYSPFGHWSGRTVITDGIVVPSVKLSELKAHPYFAQLPIVRKNLQGVNGVPLSANDYYELQKLLTEKGFDTSVLPQLYNPNIELVKDVENEKDVEEKLLIPILLKLGYNTADWHRQLAQKAGRNQKAIPDFVFLPRGELHFQNAPMIIEAKYNFQANTEKTNAYNQALSYARIMNAHVFGICDKERLIVFRKNNGYFDRYKPAFEKHWENLNDTQTFNLLRKLIGKNAVQNN